MTNSWAGAHYLGTYQDYLDRKAAKAEKDKEKGK